MRRFAPILAVALTLTLAGNALAVSVSWNSSFATQTASSGSEGAVTSTTSSNFLRAQAHGTILQAGPVFVPTTVSMREGTIASSGVRYGGANGGRVNWWANGNFSRTLSGGISIANGAQFTHIIKFELVDTTQNFKVLGSWTFQNETINCGGLVYPVGLGGCDQPTSDTYPNGMSLTTTGSSVKNGDTLKVRVRVYSRIVAMGLAIGLDGRTQASGLSGGVSW